MQRNTHHASSCPRPARPVSLRRARRWLRPAWRAAAAHVHVQAMQARPFQTTCWLPLSATQSARDTGRPHLGVPCAGPLAPLCARPHAPAFWQGAGRAAHVSNNMRQHRQRHAGAGAVDWTTATSAHRATASLQS